MRCTLVNLIVRGILGAACQEGQAPRWYKDVAENVERRYRIWRSGGKFAWRKRPRVCGDPG
jgi:hypothetical protein